MKDKDCWLCWRPWRVDECKSERAFNGGLFTIFCTRTRAWCGCDIFTFARVKPRHGSNFYQKKKPFKQDPLVDFKFAYLRENLQITELIKANDLN